MGHRIVNGIKVARAKMRAPYKPTKKNKTLTKSIDQKMAKTKVDCSVNMVGPGRRPWTIKPARITAAVGLPGIPRAKVGTMAPPVAELLAASLPAIPSIEPFPNSSGVLDQRLASLYPIIDAMVAPS